MERDAQVQRAFGVAHEAVALDSAQRHGEARAKYVEAAELLYAAHRRAQDMARRNLFKSKAEEYISRAEELDTMLGLRSAPSVTGAGPSATSSSTKPAQAQQAQQPPQQQPQQPAATGGASRRDALASRAEKRLKNARWAHEDHKFMEAKKLYLEASELFVQALGEPGSDASSVHLRTQAGVALAAAEALKSALGRQFADESERATRAVPQSTPDPVARPAAPAAAPPAAPAAARPPPPPPAASAAPPAPAAGPAASVALDDDSDLPPPVAGSAPSRPRPNPAGSESHAYTKEELEVLRYGSTVNGKLYLPWVDADANEDWKQAFRDPDGPLALSASQKRQFSKWARPRELAYDVAVIKQLSSRNVAQTLVSDCSFVSSLAISADFERRFNTKLISSCIFPQDAHGNPVVSPSGKYVVRLFFNGAWRKVMIDDSLPVNAAGDLLCSHCSNKGELWVSLLEKAYLKVMGGYDFPGSNSGTDLHSLTGWIPERLPVKNWDDADWKRLWQGLHTGKVRSKNRGVKELRNQRR